MWQATSERDLYGADEITAMQVGHDVDRRIMPKTPPDFPPPGGVCCPKHKRPRGKPVPHAVSKTVKKLGHFHAHCLISRGMGSLE